MLRLIIGEQLRNCFPFHLYIGTLHVVPPTVGYAKLYNKSPLVVTPNFSSVEAH